jgi:hypothetical protein
MIEVNSGVHHPDGDRGITSSFLPPLSGPNNGQMIQAVGKDVLRAQDRVGQRPFSPPGAWSSGVEGILDVRMHIFDLCSLAEAVANRSEDRRISEDEGKSRNRSPWVPLSFRPDSGVRKNGVR